MDSRFAALLFLLGLIIATSDNGVSSISTSNVTSSSSSLQNDSSTSASSISSRHIFSIPKSAKLSAATPPTATHVHFPEVTENVEELDDELIANLNRSIAEMATTSVAENAAEDVVTSSAKVDAARDFNPSVYLGEITEGEPQSRKSTSSSPFNNVQHVRFEGSIGLEGDTTGTVSYQPAVYQEQSPAPYQHHYHTDSRQEGFPHHQHYAEGYLAVEVPAKPVYYTSDNPNHYINVEVHPTKYDVDQLLQFHQHQPPLHQGKHHHQLHEGQPEFVQHDIPPQLHQAQFQLQDVPSPDHQLPQPHFYAYNQLPRPEAVPLPKPETLLYLTSHRETSLMKTRKFPYKYYHQASDDIPLHYIEQGHAFPPGHIRVSPWKRLIHLIGAFLPLGLLLAALKPSVVKVDNTTQPNIVLSKWRGVDLPVEHKETTEDICEDRSLCEIILTGSDENAGILHSILWNFATKSSNEMACGSGLNEIFNGVKMKDCNLITC